LHPQLFLPFLVFHNLSPLAPPRFQPPEAEEELKNPPWSLQSSSLVPTSVMAVAALAELVWKALQVGERRYPPSAVRAAGIHLARVVGVMPAATLRAGEMAAEEPKLTATKPERPAVSMSAQVVAEAVSEQLVAEALSAVTAALVDSVAGPAVAVRPQPRQNRCLLEAAI